MEEIKIVKKFKLHNLKSGEDYSLKKEILLIGSIDEDNDIILNLEGISRYHAAILYKRKKFFLIDLASSNGTFINNNKVIQPAELNHNDIIKFDIYEFRVIDESEEQHTMLRESPQAKPVPAAASASQEGETELVSPSSGSNNPTLSFLNFSIQPFEITSSSVKIGKASDNDIVIDEPSVSKNHCSIIKVDNSFFIHDEKSTNGVFVNSNKIDHSPLKNGDIIKLGRIELKFEYIATTIDEGIEAKQAQQDGYTRTAIGDEGETETDMATYVDELETDLNE